MVEAETLAAIVAAGAPFVGPWWAREIANGLVSVDEEVVVTIADIEEMITRRELSFGMPCTSKKAASLAIFSAFTRKRSAPQLVAAAKSGPAWGLAPGQWVAATGRA